jgi:hypothetical protein
MPSKQPANRARQTEHTAEQKLKHGRLNLGGVHPGHNGIQPKSHKTSGAVNPTEKHRGSCQIEQKAKRVAALKDNRVTEPSDEDQSPSEAAGAPQVTQVKTELSHEDQPPSEAAGASQVPVSKAEAAAEDKPPAAPQQATAFTAPPVAPVAPAAPGAPAVAPPVAPAVAPAGESARMAFFESQAAATDRARREARSAKLTAANNETGANTFGMPNHVVIAKAEDEKARKAEARKAALDARAAEITQAMEQKLEDQADAAVDEKCTVVERKNKKLHGMQIWKDFGNSSDTVTIEPADKVIHIRSKVSYVALKEGTLSQKQESRIVVRPLKDGPSKETSILNRNLAVASKDNLAIVAFKKAEAEFERLGI